MQSWFKFYPYRWLGRTRGLSLRAQGLYFELLALWGDNQTVRDDVREIAQLIEISDYRAVRKALAELKKHGTIRTDHSGVLFDAYVQ